MKTMKTYLPFWAFCLSCFPVFGQYGQIDSSFHTDGATFLYFPGGKAVAKAVAILPDEKILVAGTAVTAEGGDSDFLVARLHTDGSLDTAFGDGGIVFFDWEEQDDELSTMTVQADGKILLSGSTDLDTLSRFARLLVRIEKEGGLDQFFGQNGVVFDSGPFNGPDGAAVFMVEDGKFLWCTNSSLFPTYVSKFLPSGQLDTLYGNGGIKKLSLPFSTVISSVWSLDGNGSVHSFSIVVDDIGQWQNWFFEINKYGVYKNSSLKSTYENEHFSDAATIADKTIVVGQGQRTNSDPDPQILIRKYQLEGHPDNSFAINGRKLVDTGGSDEAAFAVAVGANEKIVLVGHDGSHDDRQILIGRLYSEDGDLDPSFGVLGQVRLNFSPTDDIGYALAVDAHDRILVAGQSGDSLVVTRVFGSEYTPPRPLPADPYLRFWPNPAGTDFTVAYGLAEGSLYSIRLLDLFGRPVQHFFTNRYDKSGHYAEPFGVGPNLPNGTYFLQLLVGDTTLTEKIVVVR